MILTVYMKINPEVHSDEMRWLNVYTQTKSNVKESWIISTSELISKPTQLANVPTTKGVNMWLSNHADKQSEA